MNITGRILVILVFLMALVVGGFMVVDYGTRKNWRDAYDKLALEMEVAKKGSEVGGTTNQKLSADVNKLTQERDTARRDLADEQILRKRDQDKAKEDLDAAEQRTKEAQLTSQQYLAAKERLAKQEVELLAINKQRQEEIIKQQAEITKNKNIARAQESAYLAAQERLEQAQQEITRLTRALAKVTAGPAGEDKIARGKPNPPTVYVEGKIDSVHAEDKGLVRISVGSDKGLVKDHTLEAYRLNPPQYLGMIRIVDVQPHEAVGRLEREGAGNRTTLRVGDSVASTLTR